MTDVFKKSQQTNEERSADSKTVKDSVDNVKKVITENPISHNSAYDEVSKDVGNIQNVVKIMIEERSGFVTKPSVAPDTNTKSADDAPAPQPTTPTLKNG